MPRIVEIEHTNHVKNDHQVRPSTVNLGLFVSVDLSLRPIVVATIVVATIVLIRTSK